MESHEIKLWNPYFAGFILGLVLLTSFLVLGHGLGASGASNRLGVTALNTVMPNHMQEHSYFSQYFNGSSPLNNWIIFSVLGAFLGGLLSSSFAGRNKAEVIRGPSISPQWRLFWALSGGILMGFAARIARGCTSGQALSGGALLSAGSWIFMLCIFGGGYAFAYFIRRQWL